MKKVLPALTNEILITQKCNLNCTYCFEKCKSHRDINWDQFIQVMGSEDFSDFPYKDIYIFGGEPLMNPDFIAKFIEYIDKKDTLSKSRKQQIITSMSGHITTNGTLIEKVLPFLKKYNCKLQVSLDGPEDINDKNRVDYAGKGHFQQIMNNLKICRENGIPYSIHGAVSRNNYHRFKDICKFFIEQGKLIEETFHNGYMNYIFYQNFVQIVFEDEITDEDIDILIDQFDQTINMILTDPILEGYDRKFIAEGFLNRRGGLCSAGVYMYSYDNAFNVFPCHRLNTASDHIKENRFTSLVDDTVGYNYDLYLQFQEVVRRGEMCGAVMHNYGRNKNGNYWLNWCPATNLETSGSTFCIPSKYDVLELEMQRVIPQLAKNYGLNVDNPAFHK